MKILVVIPTFYPKIKMGGPIISLYNQLHDLSQRVYVEVITNQSLNDKEIEKQKTNKYINYDIRNYNLFYFFYNLISYKKFDVFYINSIFSLHSISFILIGTIFKKIIISPKDRLIVRL